MRKLKFFSIFAGTKLSIPLGILLIAIFWTSAIQAQCNAEPGTIQGNVFLDNDYDGSLGSFDTGIANVLVNAFNPSGKLVDQVMSDYFGNYKFEGLEEGKYRIEFSYASEYTSTFNGANSHSSVQFVKSPACGIDFGLMTPAASCQGNPPLALTCFVKGTANENNNIETIVTTEHNFNLNSKVNKFAMKSQTGSVWGLTWKATTKELFSAAFVKQYATLTDAGHDAIFKTDLGKGGNTKLFTKLSDLGIETGTLTNSDANDCEYGAQVGKIGLGGIEISDDEQSLYVVNIYNNTLVKLSSSNPTMENTFAYQIPDPKCKKDGKYRAFALTKNQGKFYVGVTCTAELLGLSGELAVTIFEFDPKTEKFENIFSTGYPKGYWTDTPSDSYNTSHWLTDLAFTDEGNIVMALTDRIAHRYCNASSGRLDDQHPDLLMVWNDNGKWKLESGGKAGNLNGSGQGSPEGPGNGEFFGEDYWISDANYHSEIATGSVTSIPGTGSVISTVYDPDTDSYTGGLHKYNTANGSKEGAVVIYAHSTNPQFGKASGLGDIVAMCDAMPIEIGNLVWLDENGNGIQDAGEKPFSNTKLSLYKDCEKIAETTTDENGNYYFNQTNVPGLEYGQDYQVVLTDEIFGILPLTVTHSNIGFGTNKGMNDSNGSYASSNCSAIAGKPFIAVKTGGSGSVDHSFDIGFVDASLGVLVTYFGGGISEGCICLDNASATEVGQFGEIIELNALPGQTWYIQQAIGIYDAGIVTMGTPIASDFGSGTQYPTTAFVTGENGYNLFEIDNNDGTSNYYLTGISLDNVPYRIVLRNNAGDQVILEGGNCDYESHDIIGNSGVCAGSVVEFCVNNFDSNSTNLWEILEGDASIVGPDNESCVTIAFGDEIGSEVQITFTEDNDENCYSPAMHEVTIGESSGGLSCLGEVNVSLDEYCELNLRPNDLLTGPVNETSVLTVIYTDLGGNMLSEDTDWTLYIGKQIIAKVMDQCSGNSCWTFLEIQDKKAPEIECFDLTISCIEMEDYNGPFTLDNCSGEAELIQTGQTKEAQNCDPDYSFIITRTYKAIDGYGNMSEECVQTIYVERPDLDAIVPPQNYTVQLDNALSCEGYATDENGYPDPEVFGVPELEGVPLYPRTDRFCNLAVVYTDRELPTNTCVQKVMRTWIVFEWWCEFGEMDTIVQIFNIADMEAPEIVCPSDMTISSSGNTCDGDVTLPAAIVSDDCASALKVDIAYPGGFLEGSNGGVINLPIGVHDITYNVYDDCQNTNSCVMTVTVVDESAPAAICHQNTTMGIKSDGLTYAYAEAFDDGSYDECAFDRMEVKRMDEGSACGEEDQDFGPSVEFCCADIGQNVIVILRVYDQAGNYNECMVNVQVQDKNPPSISCPDDITINCLYEYDRDDLSEFGEATATDNCQITAIDESVIFNISECRTGEIIRTFTATDGNGKVTCQQVITVINPDPFDGENIVWPEDYATDEGCEAGTLSPDNLDAPYDYPVINEDFCDQVAISYKDRVYEISGTNSACQKIVRSWIVQDFCQEIRENVFRSWEWDQTITISNEVAPEILTACEDVTVCSFNDNCTTGPITLGVRAMDDCTPGNMLRWSYSVDYDIDGIADVTLNGRGDSIALSGEHPLGTHSVIFSFEDLCGNRSSCTRIFTIENCLGPKSACLEGLSVGLVPMDLDGDSEPDDEMATVRAYQFDASSSHPCGQEITFSFSPDPADSLMVFNCNDIGLNDITVYAIDEVGEYDFCVTTIDVQDNNNVDVCTGVEECITWPVDITINECVADLDPVTINSTASVDPECICNNFTIDFTDTDVSAMGSTCQTISREWKITFTCGDPREFFYTQTITKFNSFAPSIACPADITVATTGNSCEAVVNIDAATASGDCSTGLTITNNSPYATSSAGNASGSYPVGTTVVTYTVTDACGNTNTCDVSITVTDGTAPVCNTQDITVSVVDANADITISADQIDNGSLDECGTIVSRTVSPNTFGCEEVGSTVEVTLTVTDDSGNSSSCTANVTIADGVAPVCRVRNTTVNIIQSGTFTIPTVLINNGSFDECGEIASITLNPSSVSCADIGVVDVTVTVTDNSGNSSTCISQVTVNDTGLPVCNVQDITVQLDGSDNATILGSDLDNGSVDQCSGIDTITVSPSSFTCENIGVNDVTVTVTDNSGNSTTCTAQVTVEANAGLVCMAQDVTVYLDETGEVNITPDQVNNGSGIPCAADVTISVTPNQFFCNDAGLPRDVTLSVTDGIITTECTAMVTVIDTFPPVVMCPEDLTINCQDISEDLSEYGSAQVSGNCVVLEDDIVERVVFDLNDCGIGTISRTFIATDVNNNSDSCTQVISVINPDPFLEEDITWPIDTFRITECTSIHPDSIDSNPVIALSMVSCSNVGVQFEDINLTNNSNCQDTIARTWTVIDSCANPFNSFSFEQIIIINDEMAPVIIALDTIKSNVSAINYVVETSDCNEVTVTNDSEFANGTGADISGNYPNGETKVFINAIDRCGNESQDSIVIVVEADTEPPMFTCLTRNIAIEEDGETQVTAGDNDWFLDGLVTDNVSDRENLMFSFNRDFDMTNDTLFFNCDSVIVKSHQLMIYVKDEAGNVDSCFTSYVVRDPNMVCTAGLATINGRIVTIENKNVPEVKMDLINGEMYEMTDFDGYFAFPEMETGGSYELAPFKDTDHMAGVSTLDLILIQRHILGYNTLSNPYMLIAGDINNNGKITAKDILDLKKNILGLQLRFPDNNSWRFVDQDYNFLNPLSPFEEAFPESFMINDLNGPIYKNFIGIKIGDVNGSISLGKDANVRNAEVELTLNDVMVSSGQELSIPFILNESIDLSGLQFSLEIDDNLIINEITSEYLTISEDDIAVVELEGRKRMSLIAALPANVTIETGEVIFNLKVKVSEDALLSEMLNISESDNLNSELYTSEYDSRPIELDFREAYILGDDIELFQNNPNPWSVNTLISFNLEEAQNGMINIYSTTGKLLKSINGNFKKGYNEVMLQGSEFSDSGVYYYELKTESYKLTKRMILIK